MSEEEPQKPEKNSFETLGLHPELVKACEGLKWDSPTEIQRESIPSALEGRDIIGLAETGSGKTGAFVLPILHRLLKNPSKIFACILSPTRELAFQINEVVAALGSSIGTKSVCITGGVDMLAQAIGLAKKPHVIVATPGRLVDHLEHTKGFNLRPLKVLVLDEADKMLSMDFETEINAILEVVPRDSRQTLLFSATMTKKVSKLERASLKNPVKISTSSDDDYDSKGNNKIFKTAENLLQSYLFIPAKYKEIYLTFLLSRLEGKLGLIFVSKCSSAETTTLMLNNIASLNFDCVCLHGKMAQNKRLGALNKFKSSLSEKKNGRILIATDVASRGLDIPNVDFVINLDVPSNGKDYVHRVGRTARAGKSGMGITIVTQYDIELFQRVEKLIGRKMEECDAIRGLSKEDKMEIIENFEEVVFEARRIASNEVRSQFEDRKNGGKKRRREGQSKTRRNIRR